MVKWVHGYGYGYNRLCNYLTGKRLFGYEHKLLNIKTRINHQYNPNFISNKKTKERISELNYQSKDNRCRQMEL